MVFILILINIVFEVVLRFCNFFVVGFIVVKYNNDVKWNMINCYWEL